MTPQATALPMTPPIIPKHVTLKDFGDSKVKEEVPPADLGDDSFELVNEVIDVSSESAADSSSTEGSASSSSEECLEDVRKRPVKFRAVGPSFPDASEQWFQHHKTKTIHATEDVQSDVKVSKCGRRMGPHHKSVESIVDWTAKCRVCFLGRRQL